MGKKIKPFANSDFFFLLSSSHDAKDTVEFLQLYVPEFAQVSGIGGNLHYMVE